MIKTKGLYHSGIPVNDLDRAIEFYRDVLGMDVANVARDDLKGLGRADLRSGSSIVVLFQRPNPIERDALAEDGVTHQAFFVDGDDFDTAEERMRAAGVRIHEVPVVERRSGRGFYFFDPDGNLLQLYAPPRRKEG
jgi:catechol 2,3-dioxygenase-like lactoylglutathione lyase family enzyme